MDENIEMWERILNKPKCPKCGGHNTIIERDTKPAIFNGKDFANMLAGKPKKVDLITCKDCHRVSQSDGCSIQVR